MSTGSAITPETLTNRKNWITRLRNDAGSQGQGALIQKGEKSNAYCCIGVALVVVRPEFAAEKIAREPIYGSYDGPDGYLFAQTDVEMNVQMRKYLVAMNDGMFAYDMLNSIANDELEASYGRHFVDNPNVTKIIRNTNDKRSFQYIARFLEIAWKMSPPVSPTDTDTVTNVSTT